MLILMQQEFPCGEIALAYLVRNLVLGEIEKRSLKNKHNSLWFSADGKKGIRGCNNFLVHCPAKLPLSRCAV